MQIVIVAATIPRKMKSLMIPRRAPNLLLRKIEEDVYFVVNCSFPNSLRLLNKAQWTILSAIDGGANVSDLAKECGVGEESIFGFLHILTRSDIVRFDQNFSIPDRPDLPQSLNFWIHTTNKCNLGCSYCYISTLHQSGGMSDATKRQLLQKLLETIVARGVRHVKFRLAGGEPLTQFNSWKTVIPEFRSEIAKLNCQFDASFITNLTILNEEVIDFAKEHSISFGVSLDGLASYNDVSRSFISGHGSFARVDQNIRRLIVAGIEISINTVVTNENLQGLPELTEYLIGLDVPFRYSIVKGADIDGSLLLNNLTASYDIMGEAIKTGWQFSKRHQFCDLKPSELGFQTCASGFSGGAINVDGTLNYCHVHFGDQKETSFSIFDDTLDLVQMIQEGAHYEDMKSVDCSMCRYKSVCTSGCPVYRKDGKDPQCSIYHHFIPRIYELQARERLILLQNHHKMIKNEAIFASRI